MYYLKNKDIILGTLDLDKMKFKAVENIQYLPFPLYPVGTDKNYTPTEKDIYEFCKSRVLQEDNQGLDLVLEELNWSNLAPVELCKVTHCMKLDDFLWIVDVDDKDKIFEKDHMRGSKYTGKFL